MWISIIITNMNTPSTCVIPFFYIFYCMRCVIVRHTYRTVLSYNLKMLLSTKIHDIVCPHKLLLSHGSYKLARPLHFPIKIIFLVTVECRVSWKTINARIVEKYITVNINCSFRNILKIINFKVNFYLSFPSRATS